MKLYHCTNSKYAKIICEKGMEVNYSNEIGDSVVFLSDTPRHAFGCICFEVDTTNLVVQNTKQQWEYVSFTSISPEYLEFYSYEEDE